MRYELRSASQRKRYFRQSGTRTKPANVAAYLPDRLAYPRSEEGTVDPSASSGDTGRARSRFSEEGTQPMHATLPLMHNTTFPMIRRKRLDTLQVNLGYKCNQSCVHCHVNAGPNRTEEMTGETIAAVIDFLAPPGDHTVDLTGGAPELNRPFPPAGDRRARARPARDRPLQPDHTGRARPRRSGGVPGSPPRRDRRLPALLPGRQRRPAARQRRFPGSIRALRELNALGYGRRTGASSSIWSTTRRAPSCRRRRPRWRPITSASGRATTASSSTICSRWPTCRSSASAAC